MKKKTHTNKNLIHFAFGEITYNIKDTYLKTKLFHNISISGIRASTHRVCLKTHAENCLEIGSRKH